MAQPVAVRFRGACALYKHKPTTTDVLSVVLPDAEAPHDYVWGSGSAQLKARPKPHHAALLLPLAALQWTVTRGTKETTIDDVIHARVLFPPGAGASEHGVIYLDRHEVSFNAAGGFQSGDLSGLGEVAAKLDARVVKDAKPPNSVRARVDFNAGQVRGDNSDGASTVQWKIHEPGSSATTQAKSYPVGAEVFWSVAAELKLILRPFDGGESVTLSVTPGKPVVIFVRNLEFPQVVGRPTADDPCDTTPDYDFALLYELQVGNSTIKVPHPEPCPERSAALKAGGGKAARCMVGYYAS